MAHAVVLFVGLEMISHMPNVDFIRRASSGSSPWMLTESNQGTSPYPELLHSLVVSFPAHVVRKALILDLGKTTSLPGLSASIRDHGAARSH